MQSDVTPLRWVGTHRDGHLEMLDQRELPTDEIWIEMTEPEEVADGIAEMVVRGAPAIGIAAAYGVALAVRNWASSDAESELPEAIEAAFEQLGDTRPTAVNLTWALERMHRRLEEASGTPDEFVDLAFAEAATIHEEDRQNNRELSRNGAELLPDDAGVLTHCNTGGLATGGFGTALGVIRAGVDDDKVERVWVDETRPYLQGARLTAWECVKDDLPATLITDDMAPHFMSEGEVDAVVVGADRVVANGDVANKIGTYGLAIHCDAHDIPFYVAAPTSTIDLETPDGDAIPIEQRSAREVTHVGETAIAPEETDVAHPAFDVTPHEYVDAIVTERGVAEPPYEESLRSLKGS